MIVGLDNHGSTDIGAVELDFQCGKIDLKKESQMLEKVTNGLNAVFPKIIGQKKIAKVGHNELSCINNNTDMVSIMYKMELRSLQMAAVASSLTTAVIDRSLSTLPDGTL